MRAPRAPVVNSPLTVRRHVVVVVVVAGGGQELVVALHATIAYKTPGLRLRIVSIQSVSQSVSQLLAAYGRDLCRRRGSIRIHSSATSPFIQSPIHPRHVSAKVRSDRRTLFSAFVLLPAPSRVVAISSVVVVGRSAAAVHVSRRTGRPLVVRLAASTECRTGPYVRRACIWAISTRVASRIYAAAAARAGSPRGAMKYRQPLPHRR